MQATKRFVAKNKSVDETYVPNPARWLKNGRYLDEDLRGSAPADPSTSGADDWRIRLRVWDERGRVAETLGRWSGARGQAILVA
jgi:hypothetical protein